MVKYNYDKSKYTLLFHGSDSKFNIADVNHTIGYKDFGSGFYLSPNYGPAKYWALNGNEVGYVYYYLMPIDIKNRYNVYRFIGESINWFDFVVANRMNRHNIYANYLSKFEKYDIITGALADSNTRYILDAYIHAVENERDPNKILELKKNTIKSLHPGRTNKDGYMNYQLCVKNNRCLSEFIRVLVVEVHIDGREIVRKVI